jgi:hypothetical protein
MFSRSALITGAILALLLGGTPLPIFAHASPLGHAPVPQDTLRDEPKAVILPQSGAPVELTAYKASYEGARLFQADGIKHEVTFRNDDDQRIDAIKLRFVMYSVFRDIIDRSYGVVLEPLSPGTDDNENWTHDPPNAATFYIGAVYVEKVRFADGTIWTVDTAPMEEQLRRIERTGGI